MPRKFQLGVHRKNAFRKKRAFRLQDPDHPALSFDVLQKKVKELAVLPKGKLCTTLKSVLPPPVYRLDKYQ